VLNWGGVSNIVLEEGIHWVTPIKSSVEKLDIKTQKEEVAVNAASKDLQTVTSTVALNFHLDAGKVNDLWQKIGKSYKERIIDPAIQEAMKSTTAKYTAEELITKREVVKNEAKENLKLRLANEYLIVDELSIVNFDFSTSFNSSIEQKVKAEQDALTAKNKLEQIKFEASQTIETAKAQAESIKIQAQAINSQGGADYVALQAIKQWNGVLPQYMIPNSTVPFINIAK
jgi:regulator of protease activity HflC (stomatin/prohibitin superfamily)